jgi:hypothetical protein
VQGTLTASSYAGENQLFRHGPLRVSSDRRFFQHTDGTPFFWLGDTWWMGLCSRWSWPEDFQLMTADRKEKGFTVIQIVTGLYPDMPAFDERGANEAGFPWDKDYARINPAYFDMADLRIQWLVRSGLVPCIVGCWGYFLPWMGVEKMKRHWRNIVARWGAFPVVWCLAGEATMPYYLSRNKERDSAAQKTGWTELAGYVREIDPLGHPLTTHPSHSARDCVEDDSLLDFDMLQTGHGGYGKLHDTVERIASPLTREPRMPVVNGEVDYEGILENSRQEVQRFCFWAGMLSGAAGHTYGANGIWQINRRGKPFGPSPHGASWGDTPWEDAYRLPGAEHVAVGKRILERFEWWRFEPHAEWIEPAAGPDNWVGNFSVGIPGSLRMFYLPFGITPWGPPTLVKGLERERSWQATAIDPKTGEESPLGQVKPDDNDNWQVPQLKIMQDWVLILIAE